ncbi:MAG: DoxX family membrane protein [Bacteroidetes bacterium]|nr:MAG: DoxX family membrane protein [Bacteroidota bacterium]
MTEIYTERNRAVALLMLRFLLGIIFLFQGYGKVFRWGVENLYEQMFLKDYGAFFPENLLKFTAYYTSYVELIGGGLLILGLFRNYTLYALTSVLLIVSVGHGWAEGIWDLSHVWYRAACLFVILVLPASWDRWNFDSWWLQRKKYKNSEMN